MSSHPVAETPPPFDVSADEAWDQALNERLKAACPKNGYFTSRLRDDVGTVLPYRKNGFAATIIPSPSETVGNLIAQSLAPSARHRRDLPSVLRAFVNSAAQSLVLCGPLTYEINLPAPADTDPAQKPSSFELRLIRPGAIGGSTRRPLQYVPSKTPGAREHRGLWSIDLDPARLVTIRLGKALEKEVSRAVQMLRVADAEHARLPELLRASAQQAWSFDVIAHNKTRAELLARATRSMGWPMQGLYSNETLYPYVVWRMLRFMEFKIHLRDTTLKAVNRALCVAGDLVGFTAQIEVLGGPTSAQLKTALNDFSDGRRNLAELEQMCS